MPTLVKAQNLHFQTSEKGGPISMHAEGTFDVKNAPLTADEALAGTAIGRYGLDKQFHGDLEAASKGEMLGAGNPATGTAGYVAIEQVTGTLHGRAGSFALQHFGTMVDNKFELVVKVVPGSGTDALSGISGTMIIKIVSGKHSYQFDYELPAATK
ncbi:DUF3224 domain-containing protein [Telmatobacter sp. DSM 110680]|uniref:DUF3224 domain-containing protein n=1 Tax=Telmatobacter sp. DSM 110680 TaxID=3036704 RepID=A0AAU7DCV1_9BACT